MVILVEILAGGFPERRSSATAPSSVPAAGTAPDPTDVPAQPPRGEIVLAFAGDMHFEGSLADLLDEPEGALGPITKVLSTADVTMVNLESAITTRGKPEAKELEVPSRRYHFRTSPAALDLLAAAGIDVVTMANNHGADFGRVGLRDTLRAIDDSPIPVIGIGRDRAEAFAPFRVTVQGTDLAFLAADASMREGASDVWEAGADNAGVAAAHAARPRALLDAVRAASATADIVVVYMHWGAELQSCPTRQQRTTARALAEAGADVIVGSHAHVQLGSGWLGDTYVNYGLGNFLWYHDRRPVSGVLQIQIEDGAVAGDTWVPAHIQSDGRPMPVTGKARAEAIADWHELRECSGLAATSSAG